MRTFPTLFDVLRNLARLARDNTLVATLVALAFFCFFYETHLYETHPEIFSLFLDGVRGIGYDDARRTARNHVRTNVPTGRSA